MATPTHVVDNGLFETWIGPDQNQQSFLAPLQAMDGENLFMQAMFRLVRSAWDGDLTDDELHASQSEFIQTAGSSDALTVEIRSVSTGSPRLCTLGRSPAGSRRQADRPDVKIRRGQNQTLVYSDEVFSAEEVADIFYSYYKSGSIPEGYSLRETDR